MATYARYYENDNASVEFTNYVDLPVVSLTHTIHRDVEPIPGNAGSNTYRDDQRYKQEWQITAHVSRRVQDCLRAWAVAVFDADTTLRVYDEYTAPNYTDYTAVKMKSFSASPTDSTGTNYNVTLVVVK
jgi:hypothetical protein